jgi:aspartate aminotransferase-like enzyme
MKNRKLVMIPGPTPTVNSIMVQMGRETVSFKDGEFVKDFKELVIDLKDMWQAEECFVLSGTGTMAMEVAAANSVKSGDNVLVVSHGYFGDRFIDIFERRGVNTDVLSAEWGKAVPIHEIEEKLKEKHYHAITITHVDTSTGTRADILKIGEMLKKFPDTLYIVDGVCSTAGEKENLKEMGIDILFTASQKAFGVSPGLAIIWAGPKAMERRKNLKTIADSYMDFEKWLPIMHDPMKYYGTPPINLIWALKESVRLIKEEGLEERFQRHLNDARAIQKAILGLGFTILADEQHRAVTLTNVVYPEGIDDDKFRAILAEEGVVTANGLGAYSGKLFRLGHMGNIDKHTIVSTLAAIERALFRSGIEVQFGKSVGIYMTEVIQSTK